MTVAVVTLALVVVVLLAERWQDRRRGDRALTELVALSDRMAQRLQAPQAAIIEHDEAVRGRTDEYAPPAVEPDDDEAYWMSRDKLAELAMAQETSGGRD